MADFTNIDGVYAKDTELRSGIDTLRTTVLSNTIKPLTVTKNDTYTAIPSSGTYGYSPIIVDVQEEPWQPLEDGYSNFWFELTNDTLNPWLNFSAKNNNAVIDWGDGTGEVALDTLTPTHTYSKAGKYVVKVKGVTGIAQQQVSPYDGKYLKVLRYVEYSDEINNIANNAYRYCVGLIQCISNAISANMFYGCTSLENYNYSQSITSIPAQHLYNCQSLNNITIPENVISIGNYAFTGCISLSTIHVQAITPPTVGTNIFNGIASNYVIYVPVGTLSAYQTAWSDYADHIVEEGQTLSNAALRRIQAEKNDNGEEMR